MVSISSRTQSVVLQLLRAVGVSALLFAAPGVYAVDVNTATQEQLLTVRGIGPKTAQTIIEERDRGGHYQSIEDLSERVKGIGAKRAAAMQAAGLNVEAAASAAPASDAQALNKPQDKLQDKSQTVRRGR